MSASRANEGAGLTEEEVVFGLHRRGRVCAALRASVRV